MSKLVIVESPAKAKTIKKYLGSGFEVVASMGHIRDLPAKRLSVDIKNNFKPKYTVIKGKEDLAKELKNLAAESETVYLATDPDREGEAISWHLATLLRLDPEEKNRITFNEITKAGVTFGMDNPRCIDMDLVNAQQARRILDRLVGYKLSPFLVQKIRRGLSAGRVQSVAVRIVVDREEEIAKFVPKEYWSIDAKLMPKGSRKLFNASFYGDENGKIELSSEDDAKQIVEKIGDSDFIVKDLKKGKRNISPPPPFITSTLQQDASRKLGFQAKRTMKVAQELYEGIEVKGMGAVGLITYMRTDSLRIADQAIQDAADYINNSFGKEYLPSKPRKFKVKANAQDAHEAIRPTMPGIAPDDIKESLSSDQYKLYKLIWSRFIACQMANCVHNTTRVNIEANGFLFKASGYTIHFDGFTVLYTEAKDEQEKKSKELPPLEVGMTLKLKELLPLQHFTEPPPRYTEASLIKAMEEYGIGRPSTYAVTISTITTRGYVIRENKQLRPTELGEVVTKLMKERFPNIVNVKFTAKMEKDLDVIEEGKSDWVNTLDKFYSDFDKTLKKAKEEMKDVKITLKEDQTDIICEKCGRQMVIKYGRYGRFIACPGYPECDNVKKLIKNIGIKCPKCGGEIVERKTKKGRAFYGCDQYPNCNFASWDEPVKENCPQCGAMLYKKKGKKSKLYCKEEGCGYEKVLENNEE